MCLKWSRDNGCQWDKTSDKNRLNLNWHFELLKWAIAKKCPCDEALGLRMSQDALDRGWSDIYAWLRANGFPWRDEDGEVQPKKQQVIRKKPRSSGGA